MERERLYTRSAVQGRESDKVVQEDVVDIASFAKGFAGYFYRIDEVRDDVFRVSFPRLYFTEAGGSVGVTTKFFDSWDVAQDFCVQQRDKHARSVVDGEYQADFGEHTFKVDDDYFKGWDAVTLDLMTKNWVRRNIIVAEQMKEGGASLRGLLADILGISVDVLKQKLQAGVEKMVRQSDFWVAVPVNTLQAIMVGDGRWFSQFEASRYSDSFQHQYSAARAAVEILHFGFNHEYCGDDLARMMAVGAELPQAVLENNKEGRPIYGYLSDSVDGVVNEKGVTPPPSHVQAYGVVSIKLRRDRVLERTTVTFQDSFDSQVVYPPSPALHPHFTSFALENMYSASTSDPDEVGKVLDALGRTSVASWGAPYAEAQYHGGLTLDDVESIHISPHNGAGDGDIQETTEMVGRYNAAYPAHPIPLIIF